MQSDHQETGFLQYLKLITAGQPGRSNGSRTRQFNQAWLGSLALQCRRVTQLRPTAEISRTSNSGATWTTQPSPSHLTNEEVGAGISCPTVSICFGVGSTESGEAQIYSTTNSGLSWAARAIPNSDGLGISCPTAKMCLFAGFSYSPYYETGEIYATTNAGASWVKQSLPYGALWLTGVACTSASECHAVGWSGMLDTTDGGRLWHATSSPTGAVQTPRASLVLSRQLATQLGKGRGVT